MASRATRATLSFLALPASSLVQMQRKDIGQRRSYGCDIDRNIDLKISHITEAKRLTGAKRGERLKT